MSAPPLRLPCPVFGLGVATSRAGQRDPVILASGGGGKAKTGVKNTVVGGGGGGGGALLMGGMCRVGMFWCQTPVRPAVHALTYLIANGSVSHGVVVGMHECVDDRVPQFVVALDETAAPRVVATQDLGETLVTSMAVAPDVRARCAYQSCARAPPPLTLPLLARPAAPHRVLRWRGVCCVSVRL
jgi:hypothetical protein